MLPLMAPPLSPAATARRPFETRLRELLSATIVKLSVVPKIRAYSYVSGLSFVIAEKSTAIELEHAETNGRRQIAVVTLGIDRGEQSRQRHAPMRGDLLQCFPERGFNTDARFAASYDG
jgi:hypothetical protein